MPYESNFHYSVNFPSVARHAGRTHFKNILPITGDGTLTMEHALTLASDIAEACWLAGRRSVMEALAIDTLAELTVEKPLVSPTPGRDY